MLNKINEELKKNFKTKGDFIRIFVIQILILFSIFLYKSIELVILIILFYILVEYFIERTRKRN